MQSLRARLAFNALGTVRYHQSVVDTLTKLVLNSTFDEDLDPLSRDGAPNRLMQKLLRELQATETIFRMIRAPFARGIQPNWLSKSDRRFKQLNDILTLAYRLIKKMTKGSERNALALQKHVTTIRRHLGCGLSCTTTLKEIFVDKRKLLARIEKDLIFQFMDLLQNEKHPRYIDFLLSICTAGGAPMHAIQDMIGSALLEHNTRLLPICRVSEGNGRITLEIHVPGQCDELGADLWIDLADFGDQHMQTENCDYLSHVMQAPFSELDTRERVVRYFVHCIQLYGKLCFGRHQGNLKYFLMTPDMPFR